MRARHIIQQMLKKNVGVMWYNTLQSGFSPPDMLEIMMKLDLSGGKMYNTMYITDKVDLMKTALPECNNLWGKVKVVSYGDFGSIQKLPAKKLGEYTLFIFDDVAKVDKFNQRATQRLVKMGKPGKRFIFVDKYRQPHVPRIYALKTCGVLPKGASLEDPTNMNPNLRNKDNTYKPEEWGDLIQAHNHDVAFISENVIDKAKTEGASHSPLGPSSLSTFEQAPLLYWLDTDCIVTAEGEMYDIEAHEGSERPHVWLYPERILVGIPWVKDAANPRFNVPDVFLNALYGGGYMGTQKHYLAEAVIRDCIDKETYMINLPAPMKDNIQMYVTRALMKIESVPDAWGIEDRVHLASVSEKLWGTVDFFSYSAEKDELFVMDYKNGRRQVPAKNNLQLLCYAAMICETYGLHPKNVRLAICQRAAYKEWEIKDFNIDLIKERLVRIIKTIEEVGHGKTVSD